MNATLQKGLYEVVLPVLHQVPPEHPDSMERKKK